MYRYLKAVFDDTQQKITDDLELHRLTTYAINGTRVYTEDTDATGIMGRQSFYLDVTQEKTLEAAARLVKKYPHVGVLNFANAVSPGGEVENGIPSQEGDLCRQSNLYPCLMKQDVLELFYEYNNQKNQFYSDRVVYSPGVTVFKDDEGHQRPRENWFGIDVLTCPPPNLNGIVAPDERNLLQVYRLRIRNILAVAQEQGIQALVLGAFGCGQLYNIPDLMAHAFLEELMRKDFQYTFVEIVFAIWPRDEQGMYVCNVFQTVLTPWKMAPFYGKQVSVIGDFTSIPNYSCQDTWWREVLDDTGAKLLANCSWEGNHISGTDCYSLCNGQQLCHLQRGQQLPEVILLAVGSNDYEQGVPIAPEQDGDYTVENFAYYFKTAYEMTLLKLQQLYPDAEIYCATLSYGASESYRKNLYPEGIAGIPLKQYNKAIRECANAYGCRIIDLENLQKYYDTLDGVHPSELGMRQLADGWLRALEEYEHTDRKLPARLIAGTASGLLAAAALLTALFV